MSSDGTVGTPSIMCFATRIQPYLLIVSKSERERTFSAAAPSTQPSLVPITSTSWTLARGGLLLVIVDN